jgi:hypothetical protein
MKQRMRWKVYIDSGKKNTMHFYVLAGKSKVKNNLEMVER